MWWSFVASALDAPSLRIFDVRAGIASSLENSPNGSLAPGFLVPRTINIDFVLTFSTIDSQSFGSLAAAVATFAVLW